MFIRESEGVYKFGQKKIYIKIEKGQKLFVRIGGGYMEIKNFIESYSGEEVEKIKRNDVVERFANKLMI